MLTDVVLYVQRARLFCFRAYLQLVYTRSWRMKSSLAARYREDYGRACTREIRPAPLIQISNRYRTRGSIARPHDTAVTYILERLTQKCSR